MDAAKRISPALRRANLQCPSSPRGVASDFLRALCTLLPQAIVLYCRESSSKQNCTGNLDAQVEFLRALLESMGFTVVAVFREVGSGQRTGAKLNRPVLEEAIRFAREHGLPLVAESTDRLIRAWDFTKHNQGAIPTVHEFELLMAAASEVPLYTIVDPNADWKTVRRFQTGRGRVAKDRRGGRPPKTQSGDLKRSREAVGRDVMFQHQLGLSSREIAENVGRPWRTVDNWRKKIREGVPFF